MSTIRFTLCCTLAGLALCASAVSAAGPRDRVDNVRVRVENVRDRREAVCDRIEDIRDTSISGGYYDSVEDARVAREQVWDKRENVRDHAENRLDRAENRRDRRK